MFDLVVMFVLVGVFTWVGHDVLSGREDDIGPVDVVHSHPIPAKSKRGE